MSELGAILRAARHKKNLSILDAAAATRIKPIYLEALEDGEYGHLPGPAYITGFLRNYAAFLDLYPDDVVQEYYALRPEPEPNIKAATRVLATVHQRDARRPIRWVFASLVLLLICGFAIKQYNDNNAQADSPVRMTPANLGAASNPPPAAVVAHHVARAPQIVRLGLRSRAPVWVRVTVDGAVAYQGKLQPTPRPLQWVGHQQISVATWNGSRLWVTYDGQRMGLLAPARGLVVSVATSSGWHRVS